MTTAKYLTLVGGVLTQVSLDLSNGSAGVTYKVVTSGTGYTVGDTLLFIEVVTQVSPNVLSPVWININTGLEVTNPNMAHLVLSDRELGQTTMSRSASVTLASDQTLPLPTGAATSANQSTGNTSLASIDGGIGGASAAAAADTGASTTNGFLRWIRDFWLSLKGTKTAANSLSVTGASDAVFYVGGVSADGVAPTNQAVRVSGVDGSGLKRTLATDTSGVQFFKNPDGVTVATAGTLGALNDTYPPGGVGVAVPSWARSACFTLAGTAVIVAVPQFSTDNGATWTTLAYSKNMVTGATSGASGVNQPVVFELFPGITHIQVKCTSYTSGTASVVLAYSASQITSYAYVNSGLSPGVQRIGSVFASGIWYDDTSSALTASSTFTSTARDITAANTGSIFASASTYAKEYRVMAEQDVAFTLQIQASRDNSTFRIVESITAAAVPGGGFVASTSVLPMWRYYRYAIVNGGTNAARTTGGSILMAN